MVQNVLIRGKTAAGTEKPILTDNTGQQYVIVEGLLQPEDVIFHNASTTNIDGALVDVSDYNTLVIEVSGTATTRTLSFMAASISGGYKAIEGFKKLTPSTATFATSTTANTSVTPEIWEFDVAGLKLFKTPITNIEADKNVTVKGVLLV